MSNNNPVTLTAVNPAVVTGPAAVIYTGVSATVTLTLSNSSGAPIVLQPSPTAAQLQIFFPDFFASTEVQAVQLAPPQGWNCSFDPSTVSWNVVYQGAAAYSWADGATLVVSCTQVETASQPASDGFQINPSNMTGNVPSEIPASFSVLAPPINGNLSLPSVLQVSLDMQGSVYISSSAADPLPNSIFLTFSNIGGANLFTGTQWNSKPWVEVDFLYGTSAGSLAPEDGNNTGSIWNAKPGILTGQGNNWQATGPGTGTDPQWTLTPLDLDILQTGASASITFSFSNIVSITPIGHTQMTVHFHDFPASDTQNYNDCIYILDIVKLAPPPTRGLLNFYGTSPIVSVQSPTQPVTVNLNWAMLLVDSVTLVCSFPGVAPVTFAPANQIALTYQSTSITIPGVAVSTPIFFTLQAFDGNGQFLNALQYAVWINSGVFIDPRDNKIYPTVLIDGLYWMTENLDWNAPGSIPYQNLAVNEQTYGRLYPYSQATQVPPQPTPPPPPPPPWRLPSVSDFQNLIAAAGQNPYTALMPGGTTGFNALLGGQCDNYGNYSNLGVYGYYWTSDQGSAQANICQFSSVSSSVSTANQLPTSFLVSVRYVRNA